jgi:riboflavin kinase/FMN adenylyltransferase
MSALLVAQNAAQLDAALPAPAHPRAVVIGNLDGVHRGHRALIERALAQVGEDGGGGIVVALTFAPHPAKLLAPQSAPPLLVGPVRKRELLLAAGAGAVVEMRFDAAFAALSPAEFVAQVLVDGLKARSVCVGYDFTFGRGRAGDVHKLRELLAARGVALAVVEAVTAPDGRGSGGADDPPVCSSTRVRRALSEGRLDEAERLLGRAPELEGEVVPGAGRGRTISVPTANLQLDGEVAPQTGVYAAWAEVLGPPEERAAPGGGFWIEPRRVLLRRPAAVNIGYNPTFTNPASGGTTPPRPSIEAHLIQPAGEPPLPSLYGQTVRLHLKARLRPERRFPEVAALVAQIRTDIAEAEGLLRADAADRPE